MALSFLESPTLQLPTTEVLGRIRAEYLEMPGLKLTTPQARRLWGLDGATCDAALAALVKAKFLSRRREDDLFVMATTQRSRQKPRSGSGATDSSDPVGGRKAFAGPKLRPSGDLVGRPTAVRGRRRPVLVSL